MIYVVVTPLTGYDNLEESIDNILYNNKNIKMVSHYPEIYHYANEYIKNIEDDILYYVVKSNADIMILTYSPIIMDCVDSLATKYSVDIKFLDNINGIEHNPEYFYEKFEDVFQANEIMKCID